MEKKWLKIALDIIMLFVFLLLFNKRVLGMSFHEIGGLCIALAVIIHLLLNGKWIKGVTSKLFCTNIPLRTRIVYVLNLLLLISVALIVFSGAMISKVVFSFNLPGPWKTIHYFCAALVIILMGIHLGLHAKYLSGMWSKLTHGRNLPRPISLFLCIIICMFGIYSLSAGSFKQWLSMPFASQRKEAGLEERGRKEGSFPAKEKETQARGQAFSNDSRPFSEKADGNGPVKGSGFTPVGGFLPTAVSSTLASFFSQTFVFALLTVLLERWLKKRSTIPPAISP
ncbi:MAG: DUF4405 domain-containing protein [Lachnospiraceae bacterium]